MKITDIQRWLLCSKKGNIKYFLWKENKVFRVISCNGAPYIFEFDSKDEAIEHFDKIEEIVIKDGIDYKQEENFIKLLSAIIRPSLTLDED